MKKIITILILLNGCIKNINDLKVSNKNVNNDLVAACIEGDISRINTLLSQGANANINYNNTIRISLLMYASKKCHKDVVKLLLERGAAINEKDYNGDTTLMIAAGNGHKEVVELLLERGANINDEDFKGYKVLMLAVNYGYKEVVELLINKGANVNDENSNGNTTVLAVASENGHKEIVELLLEKGANVNFTNYYGDTALMFAAKGDEFSIVKLLIERG